MEEQLIFIEELLKENLYNICKDEEQSLKYNQAFIILKDMKVRIKQLKEYEYMYKDLCK